MDKPKKGRWLPSPALVIVAAVILFGGITFLGWLVNTFSGIIRFALFVVIVAAIAALVVGLKAKR